MQNTHLPFFGVKNFKSFKGNHFFNLKNITFLIGKNSSGKSSLIQAIRIKQLSNRDENYPEDLGLKSNWLNKNTPKESVGVYKVMHTDYPIYQNRFYYLDKYYPKQNNHPYEEYLILEQGMQNFDGGHEFFYTSQEDKKNQYTQIVNSIYDSEKKCFLTPDLIKTIDQEFNLLSTNRNQSVNKLLKYIISDYNEYNLWINELERIKALKPTEIAINMERLSFTTFKKNKLQIIIPLMEYIIQNYFDEVNENYSNSIESLIQQYEKIDISKYDFNLEANNHVKFSDFLSEIELVQLKNLLIDIEKFDKIRPTEESFCLPQIFKYEPGYFFDKMDFTYIKEKHSSKINYIEKITSKELIGNIIKEFDKNEKDYLFKERKQIIDIYLKKFEIGQEIITRKIPVSGTINYELCIIKDGEERNLFEYHGYGIQKLIPLMLSVLLNDGETILIEEPEANLHPALQSKLADFFVECSNKFNIQFIVETHSEYIIRRMQYLVANNYKKNTNQLPMANALHVNIYYFNDPKVQHSNKHPYTYEIKFNENGLLDKDFGSGFIDEASNLTIDLLRISNFN